MSRRMQVLTFVAGATIIGAIFGEAGALSGLGISLLGISMIAYMESTGI